VTDAHAWNRLACFRFLESDHPDILHFAGFSSEEKCNRFELRDRLSCGPDARVMLSPIVGISARQGMA
jgi:hypothetical protein